MNVSVFVKRPVLTWMFSLLFVFLGAISFSHLAVNLFPDITPPAVKVITEYKNAAPQDVEQDVTKILEEGLATVKGIERIFSSSGEEESEIILNFDWETDVNSAILEVREKIDQSRKDLPLDIFEPRIVRFNPAADPVLLINLTGERDILHLAQNIFKPRLQRIEGLARIEISGGREKEVLVALNENRLTSYKISALEVIERIKEEDVSARGGKIEEGKKELVVRAQARIESKEELADLIVRSTSQGKILLKDVAEVIETYKEVKNVAHLNGADSIELAIYKEAGGNTLRIIEKIKEELKDLTVAHNVESIISFDQSDYIKQSISLLQGNAVVGAVLSVFILFLFLGEIKSTLIIVLSIPISTIATFFFFKMFNITLNLFSLAGLALAVGMIVDASIVVLENTFRHINEGRIPFEAAVSATQEVKDSIIASTFTTVVVFLPIIFVKGLIAQLFYDLSFAVIFTLLFSMIISFSLVPMLCARLLSVRKEEKSQSKHNIVRKTESFYASVLDNLIRKKHLRTGVSFVLLFLFFFSVKFMPSTSLFPDTRTPSIILEGKLPVGMNLETTKAAAEKIEKILSDKKEIRYFSTKIEPANIRILISLFKYQQVPILLNDLKKQLRLMPDFVFTLDKVSPLPEIGLGSGSESDIAVKVAGSDLKKLKEAARYLEKEFRRLPFIGNVSLRPGEEKPEIRVEILKERCAGFGITSRLVASTLKAKISGEKTITMQNDKEVRVKISDVNLSPEILSNLTLLAPRGNLVSLRDVAQIERKTSPVSIEREEKERLYTLLVDLKENVGLGKATGEIENILKKYEIAGINYSIGGAGESLKYSFTQLIYALIVAMILVYMIMAAQFESLIHPFIIMFTIPFSFIGVIGALRLTGITLNIISSLGIIMLAGIVVNNAIILVSFINILRERGMDLPDALLIAGKTRLRPIMMTTLTTILGMLPLALGFGSGTELYRPLAVVVVGGLIVSTLLTLIYIPIAYLILESVRDYFSLIKMKIFPPLKKRQEELPPLEKGERGGFGD